MSVAANRQPFSASGKASLERFELSPSARELLGRAAGGWLEGLRARRAVETHVSVVLVGPERVLKFKKPLDLGFVDHRVLAARWKSARAEVLLNQRLSEGVYLGLEVFFPGGRSEFLPREEAAQAPDPPEGAIEAAVAMRPLDQERLLSSLVEAGSPEAARAMAPLADKMAAFHAAGRAKALAREPHLSFEPVEERQVLDNFAVLRERVGERFSPAARLALERTERVARAFMERSRGLLEERIREGFVVDGHGDLRAEHVWVGSDGRLNVVDCLEFSQELREEDVLSDAAFLRMDLDFLGRGDLAEAFVSRYAQALGEGFDERLLGFYSCYRAMVRAKVEAFACLQGVRGESFERVEEFVALASRYALGLPSRLAVAVGGLMGTGKSVLAAFLEKQLRAEVIATDALRAEVGSEERAEGSALGYGEGKYSSESRGRVYGELFRRAEGVLARNVPVILDASFQSRELRARAVEMAERFGAPLALAVCSVGEEENRRRLRARSEAGGSLSDGREELLESQRKAFEAPAPGENVLAVDASRPLEEQAALVLEALEKAP